MNLSVIRKVFILIACISMVGCPVTFEVELTNETESKIYVIYAPGYESGIGPGETEKKAYKQNCVRIRVGTELYEFQSIMPPEEYFRVGIFNSSIRAAFTSDKQFKILKPNGESGKDIYLKPGCIKNEVPV